MTTCGALPADGCCISAGEGKTEVSDKDPFVCLVGGYIRAIMITIIALGNKNTVLRKENQKKTKESI